MAKNYSAQGSITIKRLRNGDSLFLSFDSNGIPLYQFVDDATNAVKPDWTVAANQPTLTPKVVSALGNATSIQTHKWKWNGVELSFTGAVDGNYTKDTTGKFEMNATTGELKIIGNLASATNTTNDTLEYECMVSAGADYTLTKAVDVIIQKGGASSYIGLLTATTTNVSSDMTTATVSAQLMLAGTALSSFYVKVYKNTTSTPWNDKNGSATGGTYNFTVGRDDIQGMTLFICEFYLNSTDTTPVSRAAIRMTDSSDEYKVVYDITSANKTVDVGKDVVVEGKIINITTNAEVTAQTGASNIQWKTSVMRTEDWTKIREVTSYTVTITTADTDVNNEYKDVEVVGEVSFDL